MIFQNIDEANDFLLKMTREGLKCEMHFLSTGYEVVCKFKDGEKPLSNTRIRNIINPPNQSTLFPEEKREEPKIVRQQTFDEKLVKVPFQLRDYQKEAIEFILEHKDSIIEFPTGMGKTLVGLGAIEALGATRALVVVPTQVLVGQWIDVFKDAGVRATPVYALEKTWGNYTITTYQSALLNLDKVLGYNVVIFDEVHHLFSDENRKILYGLLNNNARIIGLTATRRQYGEEKAIQNRYFAFFSITMREFQQKSKIETAITSVPIFLNREEYEAYNKYNKTIIMAYKSLGTVKDWSKYVNSPNPGHQQLARAALFAYTQERIILNETPEKLNKIMEIIKPTDKQFIVFSDTIQGIKDIAEALNENGIKAGAIYSGIPQNNRDIILEGIRNKTIQVLVGGNAISEGLDIPDLDNLILASFFVASERQYVQRIGRVLRPKPDKMVRIYLIYAADTIEEVNMKKVYRLLGEQKWK
jgi:superfamily II DNA or RNA helicase